MKIYISGKITGDRRYKAKFREVEKKLAGVGIPGRRSGGTETAPQGEPAGFPGNRPCGHGRTDDCVYCQSFGCNECIVNEWKSERSDEE